MKRLTFMFIAAVLVVATAATTVTAFATVKKIPRNAVSEQVGDNVNDSSQLINRQKLPKYTNPDVIQRAPAPVPPPPAPLPPG